MLRAWVVLFGVGVTWAAGPAAGTPPGAPDYPETLQQALRQALATRGPGYEPRTHHLLEDGAPRFVNRLILETSPYLLQHAHNPVDWYPWGDEAFQRARREQKPVLLSIGYSTCHWCHVMERESFEDLEIAEFMNRHYVAIKVDREERPDLDAIYMDAVRQLSGRGGWPMTSVLTPDRQPFFGGTYFPPRDGARGARKGFLTILRELSEAYAADPDALVARAREVTLRLQAQARRFQPGDLPGPQVIHERVVALAGAFDPESGGLGGAPKFPSPSNYDVLLRYHRRTGDPQALAIVTGTLDAMAAGGIYDHVGGGFHRYATDRRWLVPHFEKMLYDNAQLAVLYLEAYQVTGNADYARVAGETLGYVAREMTSPEGGFYSATDADSPTPSGHEEEGWFFTWTPAELEAVLGESRARLVGAYYGVTPGGNFEGRSILHTPQSYAATAAALGIPEPKLRAAVEAARPLLYQARAKRPPPLRDDKVLTAWNGLTLSGFARGALVLEEAAWAKVAERAAGFLLKVLRDDDGRLRRSYLDGRARHTGYLEDYAYLQQGLLDLFEATSNRRWLQAALDLQERLDTHYWDEAGGGYFMTADDHETLLVREKPVYDGAEPSGNAIAILNLLRLHEYTLQPRLQQRAEQALGAFANAFRRGSFAPPKLTAALEFYLDEPKEVFVVTPREGDAKALLDTFRATYLPNRILAVAREEEVAGLAERIPSIAGKRALKGRPTAYVCRRGVCELPTSDAEVFARQLEATADLANGEPFPPLPAAGAPETPAPWFHDRERNRHWHPGHGHWHDGPPPERR